MGDFQACNENCNLVKGRYDPLIGGSSGNLETSSAIGLRADTRTEEMTSLLFIGVIIVLGDTDRQWHSQGSYRGSGGAGCCSGGPFSVTPVFRGH